MTSTNTYIGLVCICTVHTSKVKCAYIQPSTTVAYIQYIILCRGSVVPMSYQ